MRVENISPLSGPSFRVNMHSRNARERRERKPLQDEFTANSNAEVLIAPEKEILVDVQNDLRAGDKSLNILNLVADNRRVFVDGHRNNDS